MQLPHSINMDDELTQAVWRFNFRPDTYLHSSWLSAMEEGAVLAAIGGTQRGAGRLAQHLLTRLGVAENVFFDFRSPLAQIALWNGEDIARLAEQIGATLYCSLVKRVIARDDIIRLRHELGEDLYAFMHQRAPALTHKLGKLPVLPRNLPLRQRIILTGLLCLHSAFSRFPAAFWKRLMFKLDRDWYIQWKRYAKQGVVLEAVSGECAVLAQKVAIEIKMSVGHDGKILFS